MSRSWQPDQIEIWAAPQIATNALRSATIVFGHEPEGTGTDWTVPALQTIHHFEHAPPDDYDFMLSLEPDDLVKALNRGEVPASVSALKHRPNAVYDDRRWRTTAPVFGSHICYDNKLLPYDPMPANIDKMRTMLFELEEQILLLSQQISDFLPHISNFWRDHSRSTVVIESHGTQRDV